MFDRAESVGTLGTGTGVGHAPSALEVLAGIGKFATTGSIPNNGLLARPYSSDGIDVDKRVLSIPASSRLDKVNLAYQYILGAVEFTNDDDQSIVDRAKRLMR